MKTPTKAKSKNGKNKPKEDVSNIRFWNWTRWIRFFQCITMSYWIGLVAWNQFQHSLIAMLRQHWKNIAMMQPSCYHACICVYIYNNIYYIYYIYIYIYIYLCVEIYELIYEFIYVNYALKIILNLPSTDKDQIFLKWRYSFKR